MNCRMGMDNTEQQNIQTNENTEIQLPVPGIELNFDPFAQQKTNKLLILALIGIGIIIVFK